MKRPFVLPVMTVVEMKTTLISTSPKVQNVEGNVNLYLGGAYNGYGRAPERGYYDWDAGY